MSADEKNGAELIAMIRRVVGSPGTESIDVVRLADAVTENVLAKIRSNGGALVQVMPAAKLRRDFQRAEADRILAEVNGLDALEKKVLKFLEGMEGTRLSQKAIAERLGRSTGGGSWVTLTTAIKTLAAAGLVSIDPKSGVRSAVHDKIAADLDTYRPEPDDVEAVYQNVLHAIATEGGE